MNKQAVRKINNICSEMPKVVKVTTFKRYRHIVNHKKRMKRIYNKWGLERAIRYAVDVAKADETEVRRSLFGG